MEMEESNENLKTKPNRLQETFLTMKVLKRLPEVDLRRYMNRKQTVK
jgi:hypothetical protein